MKNAVPLPAFQDNYIWSWFDGEAAVVVDPGDADVVAAWLDANGYPLRDILLTHWHPDHTGGVDALRHRYGARVVGPSAEQARLPALDLAVAEGNRVRAGGEDFTIMAIPGHTLGHIAYVGADCVFCGDTLFHTGCGRLFEGEPAQMYESLARLMALDADTTVYCTHEYTLANLAFARSVEPDHALLRQIEADAQQRRAQDQPTLPTTIGEQRSFNPFLRADEAALAEAVSGAVGHHVAAGVDTFAALRALKDRA
ncbi:MAG: hydroxyacylglutathione hydrolase [Algiphilus sp.]